MIENGDSSVMSNNFDLITLDFFPQDPPVTWVLKECKVIQGGIISIRSTGANGIETFRDSTPKPHTLYRVMDKIM
jgi:hypothetical protein